MSTFLSFSRLSISLTFTLLVSLLKSEVIN